MSKNILMIGAGSIGSWTSLCLSRTNLFNIFLQDFDIFEEKNLKGQFVTVDLIGKKKPEALKILCERFNGYGTITPIIKKFNDGVPAKGKFTLPKDSTFFSFEVEGKSIKQIIKN